MTALTVTNSSNADVQVFMTLGAVTGYVQKISEIPFVTDVTNPLQGWFTLPAGKQVSYTPPEGVGIQFALTGGGGWNAGATRPTVTTFANKAIGENTGLVGVFPYACDNCTASVAPPICTTSPVGAPNPPQPQAQPICNMQRDAGTAGGTVAIVFSGFVS